MPYKAIECPQLICRGAPHQVTLVRDHQGAIAERRYDNVGRAGSRRGMATDVPAQLRAWSKLGERKGRWIRMHGKRQVIGISDTTTPSSRLSSQHYVASSPTARAIRRMGAMAHHRTTAGLLALALARKDPVRSSRAHLGPSFG